LPEFHQTKRIFIIGIRDDKDNDFKFLKPFHLEKRSKDVLEVKLMKSILSDKRLIILIQELLILIMETSILKMKKVLRLQ
jgi:hypothetical protein